MVILASEAFMVLAMPDLNVSVKTLPVYTKKNMKSEISYITR